jgi:hypothetical protein
VTVTPGSAPPDPSVTDPITRDRSSCAAIVTAEQINNQAMSVDFRVARVMVDGNVALPCIDLDDRLL